MYTGGLSLNILLYLDMVSMVCILQNMYTLFEVIFKECTIQSLIKLYGGLVIVFP